MILSLLYNASVTSQNTLSPSAAIPLHCFCAGQVQENFLCALRDQGGQGSQGGSHPRHRRGQRLPRRHGVDSRSGWLTTCGSLLGVPSPGPVTTRPVRLLAAGVFPRTGPAHGLASPGLTRGESFHLIRLILPHFCHAQASEFRAETR